MLGNLLSAAIKVAVTPLAVVKDVVDGEPLTNTSELLGSALDDVNTMLDD